jgi:hypothetical protein
MKMTNFRQHDQKEKEEECGHYTRELKENAE